MDSEEHQREKVERALGEPVLAEYSEAFRLTKRNLLIVSSLVLFLALSGASIENVGTGGVTIRGLSNSWIYFALLCITLYLAIQFVWLGIEYLHQVEIRITGSVVRMQTAFRWGADYNDAPYDPKQSSLYYWWKDNKVQFDRFVDRTTSFEKMLSSLDQSNPEEALNTKVREIQGAMQSWPQDSRVDDVRRGLERVELSLKRFDHKFWEFKRNQIVRMLVLDAVLPLGVALSAMLTAFPLIDWTTVGSGVVGLIS